MLSRRTAIRVGTYYAAVFRRGRQYGTSSNPRWVDYVEPAGLYEHLFEHDFPAYVCNPARGLSGDPEVLKEWIMRFHTGESVAMATPEWDWEDRKQLGQKHLVEMVKAAAAARPDLGEYVTQRTKASWQAVLSSVELDGFEWRGPLLLAPEEDALDVAETTGVLTMLCAELALEEVDTALHHLDLSAEHYDAGRWDDVIGNARKFMERVLLSVALCHSETSGTRLKRGGQARPAGVREYLCREDLIEEQERRALDEVYSLLSVQGGHPYMAEKDQARLLRNLALTLTHFVLLRLRGWLAAQGG